MSNQEIGKRIEYARKNYGIDRKTLAQLIGVAGSTITRYERGEIETIKLPIIESIANALHVNPMWMLGKSNLKQREANSFDITKDPSYIPADFSNFIPIPLVGTVRCGEPIFAETNIEAYIPTSPDSILPNEEYFWLKAIGDSMINSGIFEGDLLLIRKQSDVDSGCIAVIAVNGDTATLKRVIKKENAIILQPENTKYETKIYVGEEMSIIHIIGRLMESKRKF